MKRFALNFTLAAALGVLALPVFGAQTPQISDADMTAEHVRKQIATLPFYGVFDSLTLQLKGDEVTLNGFVYRPSMRKSVERAALRVEGVNSVVNNVEVLPTSFHDDRIRQALVFRLFTNPSLSRYSLRSVPPIHIVVNNGHVSLEGVVNREAEKSIAGIVANGVFGVFSVDNNLRVEKG